MAQWNAFWTCHFDPIEGWDNDESRERWRVSGGRIAFRPAEKSHRSLSYDTSRGHSTVMPQIRRRHPEMESVRSKLAVTTESGRNLYCP